jgi:hypothetical protein
MDCVVNPCLPKNTAPKNLLKTLLDPGLQGV